MGHIDLNAVSFTLPDGRVLLDDVSFRVGDGAKVSLVGANGSGKTTLLRIIAGELDPHGGAVTRTGGLGEAVRGLAEFQDAAGVDVSVIMPLYRTVRDAAPYPAPVLMGSVVYTDTWLWDKSGHFQLDTLTEGQR